MAQDKPTIYKGPTIYKTGAAGGGGGGDYHNWFDDIPFFAFKGGTGPNFTNQSLLNKISYKDIITTHLKYTVWNAIRINMGQGYQGGSTEEFKIHIGAYSGKIDFEIMQPYNSYQRTYGNQHNIPSVNDETHEILVTRTQSQQVINIDGEENVYNVNCNASNSWYVKNSYYPFNFYQSGGIGPICNFFEQTIVDSETLVEKIKFIPVKRKIDGLQGVLELYSGFFVSPSGTVNWEDYQL